MFNIRAAATALILALPSALFAGESAARFEAEVTSPQAFAYSGPGTGFYPTQQLRSGQKVTLVGQQQGDWATIDPPQGSFSWVPGQAVELLQDGTSRITSSSIDVKIGSQLSDARYVHQLTLKKGDVVQILDEATVNEGGKPQLWYKIVPQKDERRYVQVSHLRLPQGAPSSSPTHTQSQPRLDPANSATPVATIWAFGNRVIPLARPIRRSSVARPEKPKLESATVIPVADDPTQRLDQRIEAQRKQIDLMATRTPDTWDVDTARKVIEQLRSQATSPEHQGRVNALAEQAQRMGDLKQRYEQWSRERELALKQDAELVIRQRRLEDQLSNKTQRYDAAGVLSRAVVSIDDQQTFVLQSQTGETTHYVIAAPGLALANYLGARVGLVGDVLKRPNVNAPVLLARQLVPIP